MEFGLKTEMESEASQKVCCFHMTNLLSNPPISRAPHMYARFFEYSGKRMYVVISPIQEILPFVLYSYKLVS